jgi:hypothetical protein
VSNAKEDNLAAKSEERLHRSANARFYSSEGIIMPVGESQKPPNVGLRQLCTFFQVRDYPVATIRQIRTASEGHWWTPEQLATLLGAAASESRRAQETVFEFYSWAEMARLEEVPLNQLVEQFGLDLGNVTIQELMRKFQEKLGCA